MKKWTLGLLVAVTVILLGLTLPVTLFPPGRGPVPESQKVAHSSHCAGCHGPDPEGLAMVDKDGRDISLHDDWQISMMGLSAYDPFWRATVAHETHAFPARQAEIESLCLSCHAPLGQFQARHDGLPYSYARMLVDSLGLDGVSCSACHQQPEAGLGSAFSGGYALDTNRILYGQFPNPFRGPMQVYVRFEPMYGEHISTSGICAGCHTLITETLDASGQPTGSSFFEQATYHEWLNSAYATSGQACQSCHMPRLEEPVVIASGLLALEGRSPYALHQFQGANTAMLTLMRDNREALGLPVPADTATWNESIAANRASLGRAASLTVSSPYVEDDALAFEVIIVNRTGHKLPSGYPSRLLWIEVLLTSANGLDTIFLSGHLNADGDIAGRDFPVEPHHQQITTAEDVQIYELAMGDLDAHLTTQLNAAYRPLKDNRILPAGFQHQHPAYDTVAIWGDALNDPDFTLTSQAGTDRVHYKIPLAGRTGLGQLQIRLHYQSLPPRWMRALFSADTLPDVNQFKSIYAGYDRFRETLAEATIPDIPLGTTGVSTTGAVRFQVYPNPITNRELIIDLPEDLTGPDVTIQISNSQGRVILRSPVRRRLDLPTDLTPGIYYLQILRQGHRLMTQAFTIL